MNNKDQVLFSGEVEYINGTVINSSKGTFAKGNVMIGYDVMEFFTSDENMVKFVQGAGPGPVIARFILYKNRAGFFNVKLVELEKKGVK